MERVRGATGERGDVVIGWLTRVVVVLAACGLVAFDGLSVVTSRLAVEDTAAQAAREASERWSETRDVQAAYDAAQQAATEANALNEVVADRFAVQPDGTVTVVVRREATTWFLHRLERTARWAVVEGEGSGRRV